MSQSDMSAVVAALADPADEVELRRQLAVEFGREQYRGGYAAGWLAAVKSIKAAQHRAVTDVETEHERWLVLCGPCRWNGRREGCNRCEVRTAETFGQPHPDDYLGGAL